MSHALSLLESTLLAARLRFFACCFTGRGSSSPLSFSFSFGQTGTIDGDVSSIVVWRSSSLLKMRHSRRSFYVNCHDVFPPTSIEIYASQVNQNQRSFISATVTFKSETATNSLGNFFFIFYFIFRWHFFNVLFSRIQDVPSSSRGDGNSDDRMDVDDVVASATGVFLNIDYDLWKGGLSLGLS